MAKDAQDRTLYDEYPSQKGWLWHCYVEWRIKRFNRGFAVYTDRRIANLDIDKHIRKQSVMNRTVNSLVGNSKCLVCIGASDFSPNSPIKGYIRCPSTKLLLHRLKIKGDAVDVLMIDEFNSSQVCGICHTRYDADLHAALEKRNNDFVYTVSEIVCHRHQ